MARERTFSKDTATIPNGAAVSEPIQLGTESITMIAFPAAWTAGVLAFETSFDGGATWLPVFDDAAAEVSIASATVVAGRACVDAGILRKLNGLTNVRLASGPAGARVNQGADRVFGILLKTV